MNSANHLIGEGGMALDSIFRLLSFIPSKFRLIILILLILFGLYILVKVAHIIIRAIIILLLLVLLGGVIYWILTALL